MVQRRRLNKKINVNIVARAHMTKTNAQPERMVESFAKNVIRKVIMPKSAKAARKPPPTKKNPMLNLLEI